MSPGVMPAMSLNALRIDGRVLKAWSTFSAVIDVPR